METLPLPELKRLSAAVRAFLQGANQVLTPELRDLGHRYAAACTQVNARLERCQEFLNAGLAGEAVHLCQTPPDVLEQTATLSFPERPEWDQLSAMYLLPPAPPLNHAIATALNQAIVQQTALEPLLRSLRRAALVRAPLTDRLAILRNIHVADIANPLWDDEIQRTERDRLDELTREIQEASQADDLGRLEALVAEITKASWLASVPVDLVQLGHQALLRARTKDAERRLEILVTQLKAAHRNGNFREGQDVKRRLDCLLEEGILQFHSPLMGLAQPCLSWLHEEERKECEKLAYDSALRELSSALREGEGAPTLRELTQKAQAFGRPFPAQLNDALRKRLATLNRQRRLLRRNWALGGSAAAVLMVMLLVWWMYRNVQNRRYDDAMASVAQDLERGALGAARSKLEEFETHHPEYSEQSRMIDLKTELARKVREEKRRHEAFEDALRRMEAAPVDQVEPVEYKQAEELARDPQEFTKLRLLKRERDNRRLAREDERNRQFEASVHDLAIRLKSLRDLPGNDAKQRADHIHADAEKLKGQAAEVRVELFAQLNLLRAELQKVRAEQGLIEAEDDFLKRLVSLFADEKAGVAQHAMLLRELQRKLPKSPRAIQVESVLKDRPLWEALLAWSALSDLWRKEPFPDSLDKARSRTKDCEKLIGADDGFPLAEQVQSYCNNLSGKLAASAKKIDGLMKDSLVAGLIMIEADISHQGSTVAGALYATAEGFRKDVKPGNKFYYLDVLTDGNGGHERRGIVRVRALRSAPQSSLSLRWQEKYRKSSDSIARLEAALLDLAAAIQQDSDLDSILQVILLQRVLKATAEGSPFAAQVLDKARQALDSKDVDLAVRWMDPTDREAQSVRRKAVALMKKVPSLAKSAEETLAHRNKAAAAFAKNRLALAGCLWRLRSGSWTVVERPVAFSGALVAFRMAAEKLEAVPMGHVRDGRAVLENPNEELLADGRLLFCLAAAGP